MAREKLDHRHVQFWAMGQRSMAVRKKSFAMAPGRWMVPDARHSNIASEEIRFSCDLMENPMDNPVENH